MLDSLPKKNVEAFTHSDLFMDSIARLVDIGQSLITSMTAHVKPHKHNVEGKPNLVHWLQQNISQSTFQSDLATPKLEAGVFTSSTGTSSPGQTDLEGQHQRVRKRLIEHPDRTNEGTPVTKPGGERIINETESRQRGQFRKSQGSEHRRLKELVSIGREICRKALANQKS